MNKTTGDNKTSKFLLKKEINETALMTTQRWEIIIILLLRNDCNKNVYNFSVSLRKLKQ